MQFDDAELKCLVDMAVTLASMLVTCLEGLVLVIWITFSVDMEGNWITWRTALQCNLLALLILPHILHLLFPMTILVHFTSAKLFSLALWQFIKLNWLLFIGLPFEYLSQKRIWYYNCSLFLIFIFLTVHRGRCFSTHYLLPRCSWSFNDLF